MVQVIRGFEDRQLRVITIDALINDLSIDIKPVRIIGKTLNKNLLAVFESHSRSNGEYYWLSLPSYVKAKLSILIEFNIPK